MKELDAEEFNIPENELAQSRSKFECFFPKKKQQYDKNDTVNLIATLFAKCGLVLENIIKYGQFLRIDSEIDEKNLKARRLLELHLFNCFLSYVFPIAFIVSLTFDSPTYWTFFKSHHKTSKTFYCLKVF